MITFARPQPVRRRMTLAFSLTAALFLALVAVSPQARAALRTMATTIAGRDFVITDEYPGEGETFVTIEWEKMPLETAQELVPYTISLPTYLPEGMEMRSEVGLMPADSVFADNVQVEYGTRTLGFFNTNLFLTIDPTPSKGTHIVGEGGVEEVIVNGEPAVLIRGGWYPDSGNYEGTDSTFSLEWQVNGIGYSMSFNEDVALEEAIAVAESVK